MLPARYSTTLKIILFLLFINFGLFLDPRTGTPLSCLLRHKSFWGSSSCLGLAWGDSAVSQGEVWNWAGLPRLHWDGFTAAEHVVLGHSGEDL